MIIVVIKVNYIACTHGFGTHILLFQRLKLDLCSHLDRAFGIVAFAEKLDEIVEFAHA